MTDVTTVLRTVAPGANAAFVNSSANLGAIMAEFGIATLHAQAELIAQTAHESGGFRSFQENLNYSAARLCQVWPKRFPSIAAAQPFANNPRALANSVYAGRMGNRPGSNDGYDYRGSNVLQHTGATEFDRVQRRTGLPVKSNPDLLRDPARADAGWRAACSYFVDRGALAAANAGNTAEVTRRVNGGSNGLADRILLKKRALAALGGQVLGGHPATSEANATVAEAAATQARMQLPGEKTTLEQADDAKKRATQASVAAPAGAGGTGGGAKQSGIDAGTAIAIGAIVFVAIVVIALVFYRRHAAKRGEVERMRLESIDARLSLEAAPAA